MIGSHIKPLMREFRNHWRGDGGDLFHFLNFGGGKGGGSNTRRADQDKLAGANLNRPSALILKGHLNRRQDRLQIRRISRPAPPLRNHPHTGRFSDRFFSLTGNDLRFRSGSQTGASTSYNHKSNKK